MDITQLILDDHHEQRRLFAILEQIDARDTENLTIVWGRLAAFLEVHAEAEERFFYPKLLKVGDGAGGKPTAADETLDAIKDHNKIRDAVAAVAHETVGSDGWWDSGRQGQRGEQRPHGRGGTPGPDRLSPHRQPADAPRPGRRLRRLRSRAHHRREAGGQGSKRPTSPNTRKDV